MIRGQDRLQAFNDRLERVAQAAYSAAAEDLEETVAQIIAEARQLAPRDTGRLANSITPVWNGALRVRITATAPYAEFVERGTRPHVIRPKRAKALSFIASDGQRVTVAKVNHPGTKPQPFLRPAVDKVLAARKDNPAITIFQETK